MKKILNTTKEKIWATISLVWLVFIYAATMTGYSKDTQSFFIIGLGPIVLGWGIYYIWYDNIKVRNQKKSKKNLKKDNTKKESKWVEFASLMGGIILYKLVGLLGIVGVAIGYVVYKYLFKKNFSKVSSIISGTIAGVVGYLIVAAIYFSNIS
tara:strand:+ start:370 stop:828 length:459 start_codon:yes stop_codon:yes gene_type:complete